MSNFLETVSLHSLQLTTTNNLETADNFIRAVEHLPATEDAVKWKYSASANQIVLKSDRFFYKMYAFSEKDKFNSLIRHAFAKVYRSYGIDWEIVTISTSTGFVDIERREILPVCQTWDRSLLENYADTLYKVEQELGFTDIKDQLSKVYKNLGCVKLVRETVNKPNDYAFFGDKIILLDDADWFVVMVDTKGGVLEMPSPNVTVQINNEQYLLSNLNARDPLRLDLFQEGSYKFFFFKDVGLTERIVELKQEHEHMLKDNIDILLKANNNTIDVTQEDLDLYINNGKRKSFQWELWQECNNRCDWCYLVEGNKFTRKERQLDSIRDCSKAIDNLDFTLYNNLSFIGGEFFQGQLNDKEVHDAFFALFKKVFQLYVDKKIGSIWITATLTLGDQTHLYELLDLADSMGVKPDSRFGSSGLWICTSWDAQGRFHKSSYKENWEKHMLLMGKKYPWLKFNTTIILMQKFIDMYLADEFKPREFRNKFKTTIFYKQCGVPTFNDNETDNFDEKWLAAKQQINTNLGFPFFPTRSSFLAFLQKYYTMDYDTFDTLFNIRYRADELHRNFNDMDSDIKAVRNKDSKSEENGVSTLPCGHVHYYAAYSDSNKCCLCDKALIGDME